MINLKGITKCFGELQVLKGIDLTVNDGEIISIVGPSGAGKTTLLQIMGTLDRPNTGDVIFNEKNITKLNDYELSAFRNKHIGFVFQFHQLLPEFTAMENIMIPILISGQKRSFAEDRSNYLLNLLGLSKRGAHKPSELSGGEKQRIAVARALANQPDIILADEPSGSLDSHNKEELHNLFFKLRDELKQTFVIVTHDEKLAALTDRAICLKDGLIQKESTVTNE